MLTPDIDRCLIHLARGGSDSHVIREFDLVTMQFVVDGFNLPEAKSDISWRNRNSVYVMTDLGGDSMTKAGYPRCVEEWTRGTSLASARLVARGIKDDVYVTGGVVGNHYEILTRLPTICTAAYCLKVHDKWVQIDIPETVFMKVFADYILLQLGTDWTVGGNTYEKGSLLAEKMDDFLSGRRQFSVLYHPTSRTALNEISFTKDFVILNELENVRSRVFAFTVRDDKWIQTALDVPDLGSVMVSAIDQSESNQYVMYSSDFLTPWSLSIGSLDKPGQEILKTEPAYFKSSKLRVQQFKAKSKDGTSIPYFQVSKKDLKLDGSATTLLRRLRRVRNLHAFTL